MTSLSILSAAYELDERLDSLYTSRSFIESILFQSEDQEQISEYIVKLDEVNKKIKNLIDHAS